MRYIDVLKRAIEDSLAALPEWCAEGKLGYHDWVNVWNPAKYPIRNSIHGPSILAPYQMCRHCHRRSNATD